jgi:hypothetical protein
MGKPIFNGGGSYVGDGAWGLYRKTLMGKPIFNEGGSCVGDGACLYRKTLMGKQITHL